MSDQHDGGRVPAMVAERFWEIVEQSRRETPADAANPFDAQCERLIEILIAMTPDEIIAFQGRFSRLMDKACTWDLMGAAYVCYGYCSDDGFMDFRSTLISLGERLYRQTIAEPDSIAEWVDQPTSPFLFSEGFAYCANRAYEKRTKAASIPRERIDSEPGYLVHGEAFDFGDDEEMWARYPRLSQRES